MNAADERTIGELAREVLLVQDACNLSGVVHGFGRSISRLRALLEAEGKGGTEAVNTHPIAQLWADKVASLAGTQGLTWAAEAYRSVEALTQKASG